MPKPHVSGMTSKGYFRVSFTVQFHLTDDAATRNHFLQDPIILDDNLHCLVFDGNVVRLGLLLSHELFDGEVALLQQSPFLLQVHELAVSVIVVQLFLGEKEIVSSL